jgi:site-specific DNA-adenine methylase
MAAGRKGGGRLMWSYYGAKTKIAHLYPAPVHNRIIEPFAGSARYSLLHWQKEVHLYDANPVVVGMWRYLITASEKDILSLPDVPSKVRLDTIKSLSPVERDLIGFHLCRGKARPRSVGHGQNDWNRAKVRIAENLYKIRHWLVGQASYETIPSTRPATWFIDPPYITTQTRPGNSDRYPKEVSDYAELARFCLSRRGQVIVCEGEGAAWLPFRVLTMANANSNNKTVKKTAELIWTNE